MNGLLVRGQAHVISEMRVSSALSTRGAVDAMAPLAKLPKQVQAAPRTAMPPMHVAGSMLGVSERWTVASLVLEAVKSSEKAILGISNIDSVAPKQAFWSELDRGPCL